MQFEEKMKQLFAMFFACIVTASVSYAENFDVSWHGYAAQGITQSRNSNFITDNDDITGQLTELGLNGRLDLGTHLDLVGQVVYLDAGNRYEQGARIDYLFLDWRVGEVLGWHTNIHLGRYKNRHWLYSATRDVPQTRMYNVLPQSIYVDRIRDIALGSDGIDVQLTKDTELGAWEVNASYGSSKVTDSVVRTLVSPNAQGEGQQDYVAQVSVFWQPPSLNWRLGASWLESTFSYDPAAQDSVFAGELDQTRIQLALNYFSENWELASEIVFDDTTTIGAFAPNFFQVNKSDGGYVQLRYFLTPKLSGILGYDTYDLNTNDRDGRLLELNSGGLVPAYYGYMDTYTVAMNYDIDSKWRVSAEYQWVHGAARVNSLVNASNLANTESHWQMWSVQLMYWF